MATNIFGNISPPPGVDKYVNQAGTTGAQGGGLFLLITNIFRFAAVIGGLVLIFQIIMGGYGYLMAGGDSKKVEAAWAKIWQAVLGLAIVVGAFAIAGVVGRLFGINILSPELYGPQ